MINLTPENKATAIKSAESFINDDYVRFINQRFTGDAQIKRTIFVNQSNLHGQIDIEIKFKQL